MIISKIKGKLKINSSSLKFIKFMDVLTPLLLRVPLVWKLGIVVLVMIMGVLGVGYLGIVNSQTLNEKIQSLSEGWVQAKVKSEYLGTLQSDLSSVRLAHIEYFLALSEESSSIPQKKNHKQQMEQQLKSTLLATKSTLSTDLEKKQFDIYTKDYENYLNFVEDLLANYRSEGKDELFEALFVDSKVLFDKAESSVKLIIKYNRTKSGKVGKEAQDLYVKLRQDIVSSITATVVLGIAFSYLILSNINNTLFNLGNHAKKVAEGTLSVEEPKLKTNDSLGTLERSFNQMVEQMRQMVTLVQQSSQQVVDTSQFLAKSSAQTVTCTEDWGHEVEKLKDMNCRQEASVERMSEVLVQLSQAIEQIAAGAQEQANHVQETAFMVESVEAQSRLVASEAHELFSDSKLMREVAQKGERAVSQTLLGMERISKSVHITADRVKDLGQETSQISEILEVIADVSDQTNLLALNAAIEAARAGEHGKGFAVVADEVRKLAERTGLATKEISDLIRRIQDKSSSVLQAMDKDESQALEGRTIAEEAKRDLEQILIMVNKVDSRVVKMTESAEQILINTKEAHAATNNVATITEENSAATQEMWAGTITVTNSAEELIQNVGEFIKCFTILERRTAEIIAGSQEVSSHATNLKVMADNLECSVNHFKM